MLAADCGCDSTSGSAALLPPPCRCTASTQLHLPAWPATYLGTPLPPFTPLPQPVLFNTTRSVDLLAGYFSRQYACACMMPMCSRGVWGWGVGEGAVWQAERQKGLVYQRAVHMAPETGRRQLLPQPPSSPSNCTATHYCCTHPTPLPPNHTGVACFVAVAGCAGGADWQSGACVAGCAVVQGDAG
jgi:hypothetical protein